MVRESARWFLKTTRWNAVALIMLPLYIAVGIAVGIRYWAVTICQVTAPNRRQKEGGSE